MGKDSAAESQITNTDDIGTAWTGRLRGHNYAVRMDSTSGKARVILSVDDRQVADEKNSGDSQTLKIGDGRSVVVKFGWTDNIKRATVHAESVDIDLDAPAGTRAARAQVWGRAHPTLYALRHLLVQGAGILVVLLGLGALARLVMEWLKERLPDVDLPSIPWPDIDFPTIPWPDLNLPSIPWPDFDAPPWVQAIFEALDRTEWVWKPLLVGLLLAGWEVRRQRRQRAVRRAEAERAEADRIEAEPAETDRVESGRAETQQGEAEQGEAERADGASRSRDS